jgi:hypothetical protein
MTKDDRAAKLPQGKKNAEALAAALRANLTRRKAANATKAPPPAADDERVPSKAPR